MNRTSGSGSNPVSGCGGGGAGQTRHLADGRAADTIPGRSPAYARRTDRTAVSAIAADLDRASQPVAPPADVGGQTTDL
jgi:hypothetical protein